MSNIVGQERDVTAIVTDSNSGITQEEARELGVFVLPMPFMIEDVIYYEGKDLTQETFYKRMEAGERISITYPDGRTIHYGFDEDLRLSELKDGDRIISYAYDRARRFAEKNFPNGMRSRKSAVLPAG